MRQELPTPAARRVIRTTAGVSQQSVADVVGVSRETVRLWESGRLMPCGRNLERYSEVLRALRAAVD
jgi:DNA-binding transcriptional regulator YiaG